MSIQRWGFKPGFQPCPDGDYVRYADHLAAVKELKDALRDVRAVRENPYIPNAMCMLDKAFALLAEED